MKRKTTKPKKVKPEEAKPKKVKPEAAKSEAAKPEKAKGVTSKAVQIENAKRILVSTINRAGDAISCRVMAFGIFHDYLDYLGTVEDVFGPLQKILSADAHVEMESIQAGMVACEHARRLSVAVMESIGLLDRRMDDVKRAYLALDGLLDGGARRVMHDIDLKNSGGPEWSRKLWRELLWRLCRAGIFEAGNFLEMYHFRSTRMTIDPAEYSVDRSEEGNES